MQCSINCGHDRLRKFGGVKKRWAKRPAHPTLAWLVYFIMSYYRRAYIPGATFFFTVVTYHRRPILCDAPVRAALRDAVKTVQSRHPFTIDAWVLLPDHLHCIWTLPQGDADYAMRWGSIKRNEKGVTLLITKSYLPSFTGQKHGMIRIGLGKIGKGLTFASVSLYKSMRHHPMLAGC
jgi:REP element-mobilizing transposase RayT